MSLVEMDTNIGKVEGEVIFAAEVLRDVWFDSDAKVVDGDIIGFKIKGFGATVTNPDIENPEFIKFVYNGLKVGTYEGSTYKELAWISFDETGQVGSRVTSGEGERVKKLFKDIKDAIISERCKPNSA